MFFPPKFQTTDILNSLSLSLLYIYVCVCVRARACVLAYARLSASV